MGCEHEILDSEMFQANSILKVKGLQKWAWVMRACESVTPIEFEMRPRAAIQGAFTGQLPASVALLQT